MIRILVFLSFILLPLAAAQQLLLVLADGFHASEATLQRYSSHNGIFTPIGTPIAVNLGRNGLGWGDGNIQLDVNASEPHKREGDGKAPAGIFALGATFGYAKEANITMPYMYASDNLICVDDAADARYNQILHVSLQQQPRSFEWMHRNDDLYEWGIVVRHNPHNLPRHGSCIFLHVQKAPHSPTSGCTSMAKDDLATLLTWLDASKEPLLVQLPKRYCSQAQTHFKGLECLNAD